MSGIIFRKNNLTVARPISKPGSEEYLYPKDRKKMNS